MCSCAHQMLCFIQTKHSLMNYTSLSALQSDFKGRYMGLPSLMNHHQYNLHMICLMKPLLVTLIITLLSNLKGVALHNLVRLKRQHQMHLKSSKLCPMILTQYQGVEPGLGKLHLQGSHLEGQLIRGKYLLFLTMSMEISHPLKWCMTLKVNVLGER